jgi:hypothetical protein
MIFRESTVSTDFQWTITNLACRASYLGHTDVVVAVTWCCRGSAAGAEAEIRDVCDVDYEPGDDFTPFADLTESQVLAWLDQRGINRDYIQQLVQAQLDSQSSTTVDKLPPW